MPHSLRAKLSGLRYKGLLTDKDYQRLKKALDVVDGVQDAIAEIDEALESNKFPETEEARMQAIALAWCIDIIRKHTKVGDPE